LVLRLPYVNEGITLSVTLLNKEILSIFSRLEKIGGRKFQAGVNSAILNDRKGVMIVHFNI
jgi:hypothetical protein